MKMNILASWIFITAMVTTAKGKGKSTDKPKNDYAYSKEEQFSSPDVFWPIHSSLHGNGAPAASITALLHSAVVGTGEGNLGAAELTGTSESYIQIPNTGDLDGREAFCWIFNLYPTSSQSATILEYAGGSGNGVKLTQEGTKLIATVYDVKGNYYDEYSRNILTINAWNFVGFSYNKVWGIVDIFKDDDIDYKITGVTMTEVNAVGDVTIGRSVDGTGSFEGKVSCIQFFKKALFNKALRNPPTYCDLSIWDPSVLDWSEDVIPTTTPTTTTSTTTTATMSTTTPTTMSTTTPTTMSTTTPTTTSTTTPTTMSTTTTTTTTLPTTTTAKTTTTTTTPTTTTIVTPATTTTLTVTPTTATAAPATTPTPTLTAPTTPIITTTTTPTPRTTATKTTQFTTTTTTTTQTTTPPTTPTPTTISIPPIDATSATTSTTTTTTGTRSTGTAAQPAASGTTSVTTQTPSSLGLSQTSTQPETPDFVRGDQPTVTDTCYFLRIWHRNHDFQSPGDAFAVSDNRTFTECVHMCTGNPKCIVFVFHDNGECKVSATPSPSLTTTATMSSRVYKLVSMDTNKYIHSP